MCTSYLKPGFRTMHPCVDFQHNIPHYKNMHYTLFPFLFSRGWCSSQHNTHMYIYNTQQFLFHYTTSTDQCSKAQEQYYCEVSHNKCVCIFV